MPNYNFSQDLPLAQATEQEISNKIFECYGWKTLDIRKDNKYDLLIQKDSEELKIEIKEDFTCEHTGNVGVEFKCRGELSGISTSNADYYVYKIHTQDGIDYRMISTKNLKLIMKNKLYHRMVSGGDEGSHSLNCLFRYEVFCQHSWRLFEAERKDII